MKMHLQFKRATEDDWKKVVACEQRVEKISNRTFLAYLKDEGSRNYIRKSHVFFIMLGKKIIGTISYEEKTKEHAYIDSMTILPEFQRKGYASQAMTWLMEKLKSYELIDLVTHPRNTPAIKLYLNFGFVITGWKDNYFGDGEPRLIMVRKNI